MRRWLLGIGSLLLAGAISWAAGPMPDTFFVHFNDQVVVSSKLTLPPGNYKFQRITRPTDPAVFTITSGDTGKTLGTTTSATLAQNGGMEPVMSNNGFVVLDQVNGTYYLDSVQMQGMGHGFMFQQPDNARSQVQNGGAQKIKVEIRTGGSE